MRFSRLPFRHVVRSWGSDIVYTPMIMAESFVASQRARDVEMHTNAFDRPVIVQFAADSAEQFAAATELVAGKVAGVDLNCGCPQQWAIKEGIGAALLKKPDTVRPALSDPWRGMLDHAASGRHPFIVQPCLRICTRRYRACKG